MSCNNCCPSIVFGGGSGEPGPEGPEGPAGPPGKPGEPGEGVCISTDPDNALQEGTDGCLYVAAAEAGVEGPPGPQGPEGPAGPPGEGACISTDPGNTLQEGTDGCLYVAEAEGVEGPPGPEGPEGPVGPEGPAGPPGEGACISTDPGNTLQEGTDGCLFVPEPDAAEVCVSEQPDNIAQLDDSGCVYVPDPEWRIEQTAEMVVYEEDGEFDPAGYPDAQYIRVRVVGGGGGSSGAAAIEPGQTVSVGVAGAAGSYAEGWFNVSDLPAGAVPVWVGKGGAGGQGAPVGEEPTAGASGTWSNFGGGASTPDWGLVTAMWGQGGGVGVPSLGPTTDWAAIGGTPPYDHGLPFKSRGQLTVWGGAGEPSFALGPDVLGPNATLAIGGAGGSNRLSGRIAGSYDVRRPDGSGNSYYGSTSTGNVPYGAGAVAPVGTFDRPNGQDGRPGADGVVVVEVFSARIVRA
ncbi:hypothetical protein ABZ820_12500 [Streptomyces diacarni]|uniref:glycine-rich domain-containing protein n=1 Tax=Streptomyces diacarni TaxID=2800381 RepID=UPI0033F208E6